MQVGISGPVISIILIVISVGVTFYIKDFLQRRSEYSKLRDKLGKTVGKGATVVFPTPGVPPIQLYKIVEIDSSGVTLRNDLQTIFIPITKLLQSEIIIPGDNYEESKKQTLKKEFDNVIDAMFPSLFKKMFPAMMEAIKGQIVEEEGEIDAVIGIKITKILKEKGYEIKKLKKS